MTKEMKKLSRKEIDKMFSTWFYDEMKNFKLNPKDLVDVLLAWSVGITHDYCEEEITWDEYIISETKEWVEAMKRSEKRFVNARGEKLLDIPFDLNQQK